MKIYSCCPHRSFQFAKSPAVGAKAFTHLGNGIPNDVNRHDNIVYTALNALRLLGLS